MAKKITGGDMDEVRALFGVQVEDDAETPTPTETPKEEPQVEQQAAETPAEEPQEQVESEQTEAAPAKKKRVLGGVEYELDAEVADAIRREITSRAGQYGSELQRLREEQAALRGRLEQLQQPQTKTDDNDVLPPDPALLNPSSDKFNPEEYHKQSLAYNEALTFGAMKALEEQRQKEATVTAQQQKQKDDWSRFVDTFYESVAPELKNDQDIVDAVWKRHAHELAKLPSDEDVARELKRLSIARITAIRERGKASNDPPTLSVSRRGPTKPAAVEDDDVSLSELMGKQRERMRARA